MPVRAEFKLNFAHLRADGGEGCRAPPLCGLRRFHRRTPWPAIRLRSCSTAKGWIRPPCSASRANSTCLNPPSSCRRRMPATGRGCASSRPTTKCLSPAIRRLAPQLRWPISPAARLRRMFVLEENIGPVRCAVGHVGGTAFAEFGLAKLPEPLAFSVEPNVVGAALGLGPHEIGFENHRVSYWSAGVPYVTVPVSGLERRREGAARQRGLAGVRAARQGRRGGKRLCLLPRERSPRQRLPCAHVRARQSDPTRIRRPVRPPPPLPERRQFRPAGGRPDADYWIEQGIEMGRPSRIRLEIDMATGRDRGRAHRRPGGEGRRGRAVRLTGGSFQPGARASARASRSLGCL